MKQPSVALRLVLLTTLVSMPACDDESVILTRALFDLTLAEQELYAIPYPNDLRLRDDGTIDLIGLEQGQPGVVDLYMDTVVANHLGGFALGGAIFFRFAGPVAPQTCAPAGAADSMRPDSSIYLVNIDKQSTGYGDRIPFVWRHQTAAGKFIGEHSLALLPMPGFALAPGATHAAVITESLCDDLGDPVQPDADFQKLLRDDPPADKYLVRAHTVYAPLRDFLADKGLTGVVSAAVFTTGNPTELAGLAREVVHELPAPTATDLVLTGETDQYWVIEGKYDAPNFQTGQPPYSLPADGGAIVRDAKGRPVVQRTESLRFALSVPRGESTTDAGWPVLLYAHGTGGSYRTFINNGVARALSEVEDEQGAVVARMAAVGIDQVLHGPRAPDGTMPDILFFNFQNPAAAVDNVIQGGIDDFSLLRMIKELTFDRVRWSKSSGQDELVRFEPPVRFDPQRIYFMGHSQGGLTGPVFLAHEPEIKAAVLSGAGGNAMLGLLKKAAPINFGVLLKTALGEIADEFHPMMSLVQQMLEPADSANYGRMLLHHRPKGVPPKHLFISQGFVDHYTPNDTTDALARAVGLPQAGTIVRQVEGLELADIPAPTAALALAGNLTLDGTAVTAALLQYRAVLKNKSCKQDSDCSQGDYCETEAGRCADDGHFVMFGQKDAIRQYTRFLATAARDGTPSIVR